VHECAALLVEQLGPAARHLEAVGEPGTAGTAGRVADLHDGGAPSAGPP